MIPYHDRDVIIGKSEPIQAVLSIIEMVADTDVSVLIQGESGTGKELVARYIHEQSTRSGEAFVPINCMALTETLIESELFGHEKGSFTDAVKMRKGKFEFAYGGTLFLDEIGSLNTGMQAKLLRVLQESSFERVGSNESIQTDVRIISATNENLEKEIAKGAFREDLYYRLNTIVIEVPPLQKRLDDIPILCEHFIDRWAEKLNMPTIRLSKKTIETLMVLSWPGNIRQLENVIARIMIYYRHSHSEGADDHDPVEFDIDEHEDENWIFFGLQEAVNIGLGIDHEFEGLSLKDAVERFERYIILNTLDNNQWNQGRTAKALDLHRNTLLNKMKRYQIPGKDAFLWQAS